LALILFPPGGYLLVLVPLYFRRRRLQNAEILQAQKALPEFSRQLAKLQQETLQNEPQLTASGLVDAMRTYFSKRLLLPPGGLVYTEVADRLQQQGVDTTLLAELKKILDMCEAYNYGAMDRDEGSRENLQEMLVGVLALFKKIDQCLKN
jgi:hypothetical protein